MSIFDEHESGHDSGIAENGDVESWSSYYTGPSPANRTAGGGAAIADLNHNGSRDLLLMAIGNPYGNE